MKRLLLIPLISILIFCLIVTEHNSIIYVHAIGTPDAYGNVIINMTIHQWDGSSWDLLQTVTTDTNWTQRVVQEQPINFTVCWRLNKTFATDSTEARSYTRVYMNISTIWTDEELNATNSVSSDASYWYGYELGHWNQTGKPESGVTYDVATKYEAYY